MLQLFLVPILVLVAAAHRLLQLYAPSNTVIDRARVAPPRVRSVLVLAILASTSLMAMHLLAEAVAAGAPGWMNLLVLVFAWDAIKFIITATLTALPLLRVLAFSLWRRGRSLRYQRWADPPLNLRFTPGSAAPPRRGRVHPAADEVHYLVRKGVGVDQDHRKCAP